MTTNDKILFFDILILLPGSLCVLLLSQIIQFLDSFSVEDLSGN